MPRSAPHTRAVAEAVRRLGDVTLAAKELGVTYTSAERAYYRARTEGLRDEHGQPYFTPPAPLRKHHATPPDPAGLSTTLSAALDRVQELGFPLLVARGIIIARRVAGLGSVRNGLQNLWFCPVNAHVTDQSVLPAKLPFETPGDFARRNQMNIRDVRDLIDRSVLSHVTVSGNTYLTADQDPSGAVHPPAPETETPENAVIRLTEENRDLRSELGRFRHQLKTLLDG